MSIQPEQQKFGDEIFGDIDSNEYLNELYENILYNYAAARFYLQDNFARKAVNLTDALRFADLLSKSTSAEKREKHKMWAQEIIVLLNVLYPDNEEVKWYAGSVFSNTGNYQARELIHSDFEEASLLDGIFAKYRDNYLAIPAAPDKHFFYAQKAVYDNLNRPYFSFSGPTSMGKSFLMRMFIKEEISRGVQCNFALIVPTKALINEVRTQTIEDLKEMLQDCNYKVVTAAGDIALEGEHNFILVLTPERLLYLLISKPELRIDYLFIDEAHNLSGKNDRSPFYYKVVDMLSRRDPKPHFIFSSPNIPNPEVYLRLLTETKDTDSSLSTTFSPVAQIKFIIDLGNCIVSVYNEHTEKVTQLFQTRSGFTIIDVLQGLERVNMNGPAENRRQTLVYCNSPQKAIGYARDFYNRIHDLHDEELDALARDIGNEVHRDYFLAQFIKKGVAYHVGYLPPAIRMRVEDMFRRGKITTMFCTSTLMQGVNLPADDLFVADYKISKRKMSPVDFKNLIGRVGRISFNLYGDVFFVANGSHINELSYVELLKEKVPEQSLSIQTNENGLTYAEKQYIIDNLCNGITEIGKIDDKTSHPYLMMRKFALILLSDIMCGNDSLVRREFTEVLSPENEAVIRQVFNSQPITQDDDINISSDQAENLITAIQCGLKYPDSVNGSFDYNVVLSFLEKLADIFKWRNYENDTLGKISETSGNLSLLRWYTVILIQWMEGKGLNYIMQQAVDYRKKHICNFLFYGKKMLYNNSEEHKNCVFAETLDVIDKVILFSISNYFLRFSSEYKRINGITGFDNDWYEYVEYGTTNRLTIMLQRSGFSRETATYIRTHKDDFIIAMRDGSLKLSKSILECGNQNVSDEAQIIQYNMPELFVAVGA